MHHFPYQDAPWDLDDDDETEAYERKLQRKRARSRWAVALLTGISILTVSSGMILVGAGSRLVRSLDRWEAEMWEPAVAQTREETGVATAAPGSAPVQAAPVVPPPEMDTPPAASVAPPAPEPSAAAAPSPEPTATAQAAEPEQPAPSASAPRAAEKPAAKKAARTPTPRAANRSRPADKPGAEPDRDLVYGGGVSWPKGAASAAPSDKQAERPAPSAQSPAPSPAPTSSGEDKGAYEDR